MNRASMRSSSRARFGGNTLRATSPCRPSRLAAVVGQIDRAHPPLAEGREDVIGTKYEPLPGSLLELRDLKVGECPAIDQEFGKLVGFASMILLALQPISASTRSAGSNPLRRTARRKRSNSGLGSGGGGIGRMIRQVRGAVHNGKSVPEARARADSIHQSRFRLGQGHFLPMQNR